MGAAVYLVERQRILEQVDDRLEANLDSARFIVAQGDPDAGSWVSSSDALRTVVQRMSPDDNTGAAGLVDGDVAFVPGLALDVDLQSEPGFARYVAQQSGGEPIIGTYAENGVTLAVSRGADRRGQLARACRGPVRARLRRRGRTGRDQRGRAGVPGRLRDRAGRDRRRRHDRRDPSPAAFAADARDSRAGVGPVAVGAPADHRPRRRLGTRTDDERHARPARRGARLAAPTAQRRRTRAEDADHDRARLRRGDGSRRSGGRPGDTGARRRRTRSHGASRAGPRRRGIAARAEPRAAPGGRHRSTCCGRSRGRPKESPARTSRSARSPMSSRWSTPSGSPRRCCSSLRTRSRTAEDAWYGMPHSAGRRRVLGARLRPRRRGCGQDRGLRPLPPRRGRRRQVWQRTRAEHREGHRDRTRRDGPCRRRGRRRRGVRHPGSAGRRLSARRAAGRRCHRHPAAAPASRAGRRRSAQRRRAETWHPS